MSSPLSSPSDPLVTFHRLPPCFPSSSSSSSIYTATPPAHHVGASGAGKPSSFRNPWPSFAQDGHKGLLPVVRTRFLSRERKFVPVPAGREGLVRIVVPDWGWGGMATGGGDGREGKDANEGRLKATWIGHASWLVETGVKREAPVCMPSITLTDCAEVPVTTMLSPVEPGDRSPSPGPGEEGDDGEKEAKEAKEEVERKERGIRILLDPVWSERMSPVRFAGPKRFSPTPCGLEDLPDPVDLVCVSHDHYDHLDVATVKFLVGRERRRGAGAGRGVLFLCGLGGARHLVGMGVREEEVVELDWWEGLRVQVRGVRGAVKVVCTPSQHVSGRGVLDAGKALWCSWVIEELGLGDEDGDGKQSRGGSGETASTGDGSKKMMKQGEAGVNVSGGGVGGNSSSNKRLYFAGDTGYRSVPAGAEKDRDAIAKLPHCPAFAEIGELYGPFDLALLPIGCYSPRTFMSPVHCAPDDAVCIHKELRSRMSVGMHYGTVRGALSEQYEDVREPPRLWKEEAERAGLRWGKEVGVCNIGETVLV